CPAGAWDGGLGSFESSLTKGPHSGRGKVVSGGSLAPTRMPPWPPGSSGRMIGGPEWPRKEVDFSPADLWPPVWTGKAPPTDERAGRCDPPHRRPPPPLARAHAEGRAGAGALPRR